jgi:hypothetical protein
MPKLDHFLFFKHNSTARPGDKLQSLPYKAGDKPSTSNKLVHRAPSTYGTQPQATRALYAIHVMAVIVSLTNS